MLLRSFGGQGPELEPGKGINYTRFSYSLPRPSHPFFLFPSLPLPPCSFFQFLSLPSLLSSLPPLFAFPVPHPSIFLACHPSIGFCFSILFFRFSSGQPLAVLAPGSVPLSLSPHAQTSLCVLLPHFPGWTWQGEEQRNQAFCGGPPQGSAGLQVSASNLSERKDRSTEASECALAACPSPSLGEARQALSSSSRDCGHSAGRVCLPSLGLAVSLLCPHVNVLREIFLLLFYK